ncbi:MAG: hypothetical protein HYU78_16725 [Rhodocyclales bacterium]|nr:hypothetical protein [Rhodocyclales bacterium]
MELIARISVRRHLLGDGPHPEPAPPLTVFRLLGRSPDAALRILQRTLGDGDRATVALSIDSPELSSSQRKVYQAIVSACRQSSRELIVCGGSREACLATDGFGKGAKRWYPSINHLLCASLPEASGSATPRGRKPQDTEAAAPARKAAAQR